MSDVTPDPQAGGAEGPPAVATGGHRSFGALMAAIGVIYFLAGFSSLTAPEFATVTAPSPGWTRRMIETVPLPVDVARGKAVVEGVGKLHASGRLFYLFLLVGVPASLLFLRRLNPQATIWVRVALGEGRRIGGIRVTQDRMGPMLMLCGLTGACVVVASIASQRLASLPLPASAVQGLLVGACVWLIWRSDGLAGRFALLREQNDAATRWWRVGLRGAVAGVVVLLLFHPERWGVRMSLISGIWGFGDYALGPWGVLAAMGALLYAIKFWLAGCVAYTLARPDPPGVPLARRFCWPLAALAVWVLGASAAYFGIFVPRYDVGKSLGEVVQVNTPAEPPQTILTLLGPGAAPFIGIAPRVSEGGIPLSDEGARAVRSFIESRGSRTALKNAADDYLFEVACSEWALERQIETMVHSCRHCAFWSHAAMLVDLLMRCRISPPNEAALLTLVDRRYFRYPTRASEQMAVELLMRFGLNAEAVARAQEAGLAIGEPPVDAASLPPPFNRGRIQGAVEMNGKPCAGLRVGVVLANDVTRLSGDLVPMDQQVICAAATTDSMGRFALDKLGRGVYLLVLSGPIGRLPAQLTRLRLSGAPSRLFIADSHPQHDIGSVNIRVLPPADGPGKTGGSR